MIEKIAKKKYYKITFDLASPLALGSGDNDRTDKDLLRDSAGCPYIPASSVAGVVRDYLLAKDRDKVKKYLGDVTSDRYDSSVIFYDALISSGEWTISVRDSVALDEYKTAKKGAKFDMEVLEPGVTFTTYIEQNFTDDGDEDYGEEIIRAFRGGDIFFGGKSMRGFGRLSNIRAFEKEFLFPDDTEKWLEFDLFETSDWTECHVKTGTDSLKEVKLSLRLRDGISIRRYTTRVSTDNKTQPDQEQLTLMNGTPVIPGSSWAGAIAHRMREFGIYTENKGSIFGYVVEGDGTESKARSSILFAESQIKGGSFKTLSRNAIDRFTGGTVDGALFTERVYYGGTTELLIGWRPTRPIPEKEASALAAALTDLHYGLLAVGGETSIGRGLFRIERVNGQIIPENTADNSEKIYNMILAAIKEAFK